MTEASGAAISNEPVVAALPTPISVEPRVAPAEAAEIARQADEAKVAASETKKAAEPKGDEPKKPAGSIRDSIAKAQAKVNAEPTPAKPLSVAVKEAEPVAATKDTKAEPAAKTAEPAKAEPTAPVRGEDGKFVSTKPAAETGAKAEPVKAAETAPKPALPSHTAEAPPARFSAAAKEKWAEAPDEVRAEVTRAVTELTKGFEKHRTAAERDASLAEFHEMATKGGTTVKEALSKYVGMENLIRKDPIAGLQEIAKNAGLLLRDVAAKILNQPADQVQSQSEARVRTLEARLEKAEAALNASAEERQKAATDTTTEAVTKFASDPAHSRFEELSEDIAFFLKSGRTKDLAEAYKMAERLNPAPAVQAQAELPAAASSAPALKLVAAASSSDSASAAGAKSIAGTPTAGSDPVRKQPSSSIKEALRRAAARAG